MPPKFHFHVQMTLNFYTDVEILQMLAVDSAWSMSMWLIDASAKPANTVKPSQVALKGMSHSDGNTEITFWPPPKKERKQRQGIQKENIALL
eukprot:720348-Amphidinium_carterae.3